MNKEQHKVIITKPDGKKVNGCAICHKQLTKKEDFVRERQFETNFGTASGRACESCYQSYKVKTVAEILGGLRGI